MDLTRRAVRRHLDDTARLHDHALATERQRLTRLVETGGSDTRPADDPAGAVGRRHLLRLGGLAVATSAVVAACGSSSEATPSTTPAPTTSTTTGNTPTGSTASDITALRTASSLEHLVIDAYQTALGTGLVTDPSIRAAAQAFQEQHGQHATAFETATTQAGGTAFTTANPVVKAQLVDPAVAKLKTQTDVLVLAYQLEAALSQTFQADVGTFSKAALNKTTASVLGVESRHVALLALLLQQMQQPPSAYPAYPTNGFATAPQAVKPGTGV